MLNDEIGVVCGDESWTRKIKIYNLHTGAELNCLTAKGAWGLAKVKFHGKVALAVSYK